MSNLGPYRSQGSYLRALTDRIHNYCEEHECAFEPAKRQFIIETFYARLFTTSPDRWLLKGGTSLALHIGRYRFTRDIDCAYLSRPSTKFHAEIRDSLLEACQVTHLDPFTFSLRATKPLHGVAGGISFTVLAEMTKNFQVLFPIDVVPPAPMLGSIVHSSPVPTITMPGMPPHPQVRLYPIEDHVADKISAMYTRHGPLSIPSTRYRDLLDLNQIFARTQPDPKLVEAALILRERSRPHTIPQRILTPGPNWPTGFGTFVANLGIDLTYETAMRSLSRHLDPVLQRVHRSPLLNRGPLQSVRRPPTGRET